MANHAGTSFELARSEMPQGQIYSVQFGPQAADPILVASLDKTVRFFDSSTGDHIDTHTYASEIMAATYLKSCSSYAVSGSDGIIRLCTYPSQEHEPLGSGHSQPVRCLSYHKGMQVLFSGSWDGTLKAFDVRKKVEIGHLKLSGKVFCMDISEKAKKLVVGTSDRNVYILDISNKDSGVLSTTEEVRTETMKYQLRSIACFPDGKGFALTTVEGRVSWEYFKDVLEQTNSNLKQYAFKCHREKFEEGQEGGGVFSEKIWPVNAVAMHPSNLCSFATGGSEGLVMIWDGLHRKRLFRLPANFPTSVTALAFNAQGTKLAMAASYDYVLGSEPPGRPQHGATEADVLKTVMVTVRNLKPEDYTPKTKQ
eukprot:GHVH01006559.1.p1 GENE.GHVH01006559.1~~GHVH01006559.1.p1  ORF type:complete len:367 (+),score=52.64 GHVH01006559.1:37-1137(+)